MSGRKKTEERRAMKVIKGLKKIYKSLNWYNRRKLIEANRPFGKKPRKEKKK